MELKFLQIRPTAKAVAPPEPWTVPVRRANRRGRAVRGLPALLCVLGILAGAGVSRGQPIPVIDPVPAENLTPSWKVVSYAETTGLGRSKVSDIDFESNGTAWIATTEGLYRYDGYRWKSFSLESGLPTPGVRCVLVTHDGKLWVGTEKGAGIFDGVSFDRKGSETHLAGPSVRRIHEDPDGTIWFCSDRWPNPSLRAGLTSYKDGVWTTYRTEDGLPDDHVYTYFRASDGSQYVSTRQGVAQKQGDHWVRCDFQTSSADDYYPWHLVETPQGGILAPGSGEFHLLQDGLWSLHPLRALKYRVIPNASVTTRSGDTLICNYNGANMVVSAWNGTEFVPISSTIEMGVASIHRMVEAPDGAIWVVGPGLLTRWERSAGEWAEFNNLPPPRYLDQQGHAVFTNGNVAAYRYQEKRFVRVPGLYLPTISDEKGNGWIFNKDQLVQLKFGAKVAEFGPKETKLTGVRMGVSDNEGRWWFLGKDPEVGNCLSVFDGTSWKNTRLPELDGRGWQQMAADPVKGIWIVLNDANGQEYPVLYFDGQSSKSYPPINSSDYSYRYGVYSDYSYRYGTPSLFVAGDGLVGYCGWPGISRLDRKSGQWASFPEITGKSRNSVNRDGEVWFVMDAFNKGDGGIARWRQGTMKSFPLGLLGGIWLTADDTLYIGGQGCLYVVPPKADGPPTQLSVLGKRRVNRCVKDAEGSLWLDTGDRVLRYRPSAEPPATSIDKAPAKVRQDGNFTAEVEGVKRWAPASEQKTFRFSWRFDEESWSDFQSFPNDGLPVSRLTVGQHVVQVRCQDEALNVDPHPVLFSFEVSAVPLQERVWFRPAVVSVAILLLVLSIVAMDRAWKYRRARDELEERVRERTAELSRTNASLKQEIAERLETEAKLEKTHRQLVDASRQAGMAEVATGVLHNVGNVLNSINVSVTVVLDKIKGSKAVNVGKVSQLLEENSAALGPFFTENEKGRQLRPYLAKLSDHLAQEQQQVLQEFDSLSRNVEHIREIVVMQQSYAKIANAVETIPLAELVEDALRIQSGAFARHALSIVRDFRRLPPITVDRHKVLQILVNLFSNAKYACDAGPAKEKRLIVSLRPGKEGFVQIEVADNGIGILPENLTRIFSHGFTTRPKGHGFGLHSAALAAKELGGELVARSDGAGQGASFTLELPLQPPARKGTNHETPEQTRKPGEGNGGSSESAG